MPVIGRGGICFDDLSPPQRGKRLRTWRAGVLADQRGATAAMDWSDGGGNNDSQAYEFPEANTKERTIQRAPWILGRWKLRRSHRTWGRSEAPAVPADMDISGISQGTAGHR